MFVCHLVCLYYCYGGSRELRVLLLCVPTRRYSDLARGCQMGAVWRALMVCSPSGHCAEKEWRASTAASSISASQVANRRDSGCAGRCCSSGHATPSNCASLSL